MFSAADNILSFVCKISYNIPYKVSWIFYRFSGRIKTFCRSAISRDFMAVQMKNFVSPLFERFFKVRETSSFGTLKELVELVEIS
jgi:hypothetical protein